GGNPAINIAAWNGNSWTALGTGLAGRVNALLVMPNGDLIAGGRFTLLGGAQGTRVARWNGTNWSAVGNTPGNEARALAIATNGDLLMAAPFVDGSSSSAMARWDGSTWMAEPAFDLPPGITPTLVRIIEQRASNEYIVSGNFLVGGTVESLVSWDGAPTTVTPITPPGPGAITSVHISDNGDVVAGGEAANASLARWNGTTWNMIAGAAPAIKAMVEHPNGSLLVSALTRYDESACVTQWNGVTWQPTGADEPP